MSSTTCVLFMIEPFASQMSSSIYYLVYLAITALQSTQRYTIDYVFIECKFTLEMYVHTYIMCVCRYFRSNVIVHET